MNPANLGVPFYLTERFYSSHTAFEDRTYGTMFINVSQRLCSIPPTKSSANRRPLNGSLARSYSSSSASSSSAPPERRPVLVVMGPGPQSRSRGDLPQHSTSSPATKYPPLASPLMHSGALLSPGISPSELAQVSVLLDFSKSPPTPAAPYHSLGSVWSKGQPGWMPIESWLQKTDRFGTPPIRRFRASDGQDYTWYHHLKDGQDWTCLNQNGYLVASYYLDSISESGYNTVAPTLAISEAWSHLACEMVATLIIMRRIDELDLE